MHDGALQHDGDPPDSILDGGAGAGALGIRVSDDQKAHHTGDGSAGHPHAHIPDEPQKNGPKNELGPKEEPGALKSRLPNFLIGVATIAFGVLLGTDFNAIQGYIASAAPFVACSVKHSQSPEERDSFASRKTNLILWVAPIINDDGEETRRLVKYLRQIGLKVITPCDQPRTAHEAIKLRPSTKADIVIFGRIKQTSSGRKLVVKFLTDSEDVPEFEYTDENGAFPGLAQDIPMADWVKHQQKIAEQGGQRARKAFASRDAAQIMEGLLQIKPLVDGPGGCGLVREVANYLFSTGHELPAMNKYEFVTKSSSCAGQRKLATHAHGRLSDFKWKLCIRERDAAMKADHCTAVANHCRIVTEDDDYKADHAAIWDECASRRIVLAKQFPATWQGPSALLERWELLDEQLHVRAKLDKPSHDVQHKLAEVTRLITKSYASSGQQTVGAESTPILSPKPQHKSAPPKCEPSSVRRKLPSGECSLTDPPSRKQSQKPSHKSSHNRKWRVPSAPVCRMVVPNKHFRMSHLR